MPGNNSVNDLRLIDKYLESVNVYWSSILMINGLLLTFFSLDALSAKVSSNPAVYLLVTSCAISLWLVIWNFKIIKLGYYEMGQTDVNDMPEVPPNIFNEARNEEERKRLIEEYSEEWRSNHLLKANNRHKYLMLRESIFEWLLVLETILVLLILLSKE